MMKMKFIKKLVKMFISLLISFLLLSCLSISRKDLFNEYFQIASLFYEKLDYAKAAEYYKKALNLEKQNEKVLFNLSLCHTENKEYKKAIKLLEKGLRITDDANKITYYLQIGTNYYYLTEVEDALAWYKKAEEIEKKNGESKQVSIYINQAVIYQKMNEIDIAVEYYKKSLKISNNKTALNNLAHIFYEKNDTEYAGFYFRKLIKLDQNNAEIKSKLIEIDYSLGFIDEARNTVNKAIEEVKSKLPYYIAEKENKKLLHDLLFWKLIIEAGGFFDRTNSIEALQELLELDFQNIEKLKNKSELSILLEDEDVRNMLIKYGLIAETEPVETIQ